MFLKVEMTYFVFSGIFSMFTKTGTLTFCGCPEPYLISIIQSLHFVFCLDFERNLAAFLHTIFLFLIIAISTNFLEDQEISFTLTAFEELLKAYHSGIKQHCSK